MDRVAAIGQKAEAFYSPQSDETTIQEANQWLCEWKSHSDMVFSDSLLVLENSPDNRSHFICGRALIDLVRNHFELFNAESLSRLVTCLLAFINNRKDQPAKEGIITAIICLVDISLKGMRPDFTIATIWDAMPTEALQVSALRYFMLDEEESFCRHQLKLEKGYKEAAFNFGLMRLGTLPVSVEWLGIWKAMITIAENNELFVPLIPRWQECLGDLDMIKILIDICSTFLEIQVVPHGTIHRVVLEFGGRLSQYLRQMFAETGDLEVVTCIGELWTNLLYIEDENISFLVDGCVPMMKSFYDEFFVSGGLLLECFDRIPDWTNDDWLKLVEHIIGMAECFGVPADNVGHVLEPFVPRALDFIIAAMDRGFVFQAHNARLLRVHLYESAPTRVLDYLMERLCRKSPALLLATMFIVQEGLPERGRELFTAYTKNLEEFAKMSPPSYLICFATKAFIHIPEEFDFYWNLAMNAFRRDPNGGANDLDELIRSLVDRVKKDPKNEISAKIMTTLAGTMPMIVSSFEHLDEDGLTVIFGVLPTLIVCFDDSIRGPVLEGAGMTIMRLLSSQNSVVVGLDLAGTIVGKLCNNFETPESVSPLILSFGRSIAKSIVNLHHIHVIEDVGVQASLAKTMAVCLGANLLTPEDVQSRAEWIERAIGRIDVLEYLLCIPYLAPLFPMVNTAAFIASYEPHESYPYAMDILRRCYTIMLQRVNVETWKYLPIELFMKCFATDDDFFATEGSFFALTKKCIPAEAIPMVLQVLLNICIRQYSFVHLAKVLPCLRVYGQDYPEAFVAAFNIVANAPQPTESIQRILAGDGDMFKSFIEEMLSRSK